ncbi:MAG: hypothetical protein HOV68_16830, partial [Streptomycetaceae bacterium]|nr:hypothetical protein [Streptomycetaceae bacterium]
MTTKSRPRGQTGHLLLAETARAASGRRQDHSTGAHLTLLAGLPPRTFFPDTVGADVVQVDDPATPHPLLARVQHAGRHEGPTVVYVSGRLVCDHRRGDLHIALRDATRRNVRYTGLPWAWLTDALAARPAVSTLVIVDVTAEPDAWTAISRDPTAFTRGMPVWGAVTPAPARGDAVDGAAPFTRALAHTLTRGAPRLPDRITARD